MPGNPTTVKQNHCELKFVEWSIRTRHSISAQLYTHCYFVNCKFTAILSNTPKIDIIGAICYSTRVLRLIWIMRYMLQVRKWSWEVWAASSDPVSWQPYSGLLGQGNRPFSMSWLDTSTLPSYISVLPKKKLDYTRREFSPKHLRCPLLRK